MNKILITLALIADAALVVNVIHHWDAPAPQFQINCNTAKGLTVCLAHNEEKES